MEGSKAAMGEKYGRVGSWGLYEWDGLIRNRPTKASGVREKGHRRYLAAVVARRFSFARYRAANDVGGKESVYDILRELSRSARRVCDAPPLPYATCTKRAMNDRGNRQMNRVFRSRAQ